MQVCCWGRAVSRTWKHTTCNIYRWLNRTRYVTLLLISTSDWGCPQCVCILLLHPLQEVQMQEFVHWFRLKSWTTLYPPNSDQALDNGVDDFEVERQSTASIESTAMKVVASHSPKLLLWKLLKWSLRILQNVCSVNRSGRHSFTECSSLVTPNNVDAVLRYADITSWKCSKKVQDYFLSTLSPLEDSFSFISLSQRYSPIRETAGNSRELREMEDGFCWGNQPLFYHRLYQEYEYFTSLLPRNCKSVWKNGIDVCKHCNFSLTPI